MGNNITTPFYGHSVLHWQKDFCISAEKKRNDPGKSNNFLGAVAPNSGKTFAGCLFSKRGINTGDFDQVIIAVPNCIIKDQWPKEALPLGLNLSENITNRKLVSNSSKNNVHGFVVTYAAIQQSPDLYRKITSDKKTLVILDEIHHLASDAKWGESCKYAFDNASFILSLTGTPFRTDSAEIPFQDYQKTFSDNGLIMEIKPDFQFSLKETVDLGISRPLEALCFDGSIEWDNDGEKITSTFDETIDSNLESQRLNTALSPELSFTKNMMVQAYQKIDGLRIKQPKAKMMIVGKDKDHVEKLANYYFKATSDKPVIVHEGINNTSQIIGEFKTSDDKAIFSCKMLSEGTNIKSLRIVLYLTNITSMSTFIQIVTRAVRKENFDQTGPGYIYMPADNRLKNVAEKLEIINMVTVSSNVKEENVTGNVVSKSTKTFTPLDAKVTSQTSIYRSKTFTSQQLKHAKEYKEKNGLEDFDVSDSILALILSDKNNDKYFEETSFNISSKPLIEEETIDEKLHRKRKISSSHANKLAHKKGCHPKEIHKQWIERGGSRQDDSDLTDLDNKIFWLKNQLDAPPAAN